MTILIPRDALFGDLFPEAAGDIERVIADYYAVGPVRPTVTVDDDVVRIEVDVERTHAYQADFDKAVGLAQRGKLLRSRKILERLVEAYPAESDLQGNRDAYAELAERYPSSDRYALYVDKRDAYTQRVINRESQRYRAYAPARPAAGRNCCKRCSAGKPCGDSCISRSKSCNRGPGCAC